MNLARELLNSSSEQLMERLLECEPTSVVWTGITDELQRRRLSDVNAVLQRSEALSKAFTTQLEQLISISDTQRTLALKLDRETGVLIRLTRVLVWFTFILLLLTAYLGYDAYEKTKHPETPARNEPQPEQPKP